MRIPVVTFAVLVFIAGCQPSQRNLPSYAKSQTDQKNSPDYGDPNQPDSGIEDDDGSLPPYLFSLQQAEAIKTLVDDYVRPQQPEIPMPGKVSTGYTQLRSFLADFVNRAFTLPNLKPGRTFKVTIMDDDIFNAAASGYQGIVVQGGLIKRGGPVGFLNIICHETAHSAKNHAAAREMDMFAHKTELEQFDSALDAYMSQAYDPNSSVYTHNQAEYLRLKQQWDRIASPLSDFIKHTESEADILGGMICAQMGLNPEDFLSGFKENVSIFIDSMGGQNEDATSIPDRERIPMTMDESYSFVTQYLFPIVEHPTWPEREKQLERVMPALKKWSDSTQRLADQWIVDIDRQKGLSLTGESDASEPAENHIIRLTSSSGLSINVVKPLGCQHSRIHR